MQATLRPHLRLKRRRPRFLRLLRVVVIRYLRARLREESPVVDRVKSPHIRSLL
jgi:hypothetical protein